MHLSTNRIHPLFLGASLVVLVACLYWAESLLKPVALAVLLTFLLNPLVGILERTGLRRIPAVIIASVIAFSILGAVAWAITYQIQDLADDLPKYKENIKQKIVEFRMAGKESSLEKVHETVKEVIEDVQEEERVHKERKKKIEKKKTEKQKIEPVPVIVEAYRPSGFDQIPSVVKPLLNPLINVGLVIVLVIFMLLQLEEFRNRLLCLVGPSRLNIATKALDEMGERISRYLLTQFLLNMGFGVILSVGLFFVGVPYALALGLIAGFLRYIPYLGPWLGAILIITVSLSVFQGWVQPIIVMGLFWILEIILGIVLEPVFFGQSAGVAKFPLLVAIAFWTWLWGPIGLLLATPLTVCLVVLGKYIPGMEFIVILFEDQPNVELSLKKRVHHQKRCEAIV